MMTPLRFEELYQDEWLELEGFLDRLTGRTKITINDRHVSAARAAALYRRACEHLALARARSYPNYIVGRLERLTDEAHQRIYHHRELGFSRLLGVITSDFPRTVRAHKWYVLVATALFMLPTLAVGALVYVRPEMILSVVTADMAAEFEEMYSPTAESIGRTREASTDWMMFGFYIRNNIGVAFQCFAGGLFAGLGTVFFLVYNGAFGGAVAGYLTERGLSSTFYSFIATHSAFEITAIVIAGTAGLRLGHSLLAPGRRDRRSSLVDASRDTVVLVYGVTAMLIVAAAVEAFWSSANWLNPVVKYTVAAVCWISVIAYFVFQGRRAG
jgi:uncharacterized membrane protein SpoIIM required for sporulation